jgi:hypothetical protein
MAVVRPVPGVSAAQHPGHPGHPVRPAWKASTCQSLLQWEQASSLMELPPEELLAGCCPHRDQGVLQGQEGRGGLPKEPGRQGHRGHQDRRGESPGRVGTSQEEAGKACYRNLQEPVLGRRRVPMSQEEEVLRRSCRVGKGFEGNRQGQVVGFARVLALRRLGREHEPLEWQGHRAWQEACSP